MGLLTTTLGWFPKSAELRRARWEHAEGEIELADLRAVEERAIAEALRLQESLGLDLLVDGQLDRGDMVTFFAEKLEGMELAGLVRCHGNRYYRRPRIEGDLSRPAPMTVAAWKAAAETASRPVRAILTGPYTMMDWSFDEHYGSRERCCMALAAVLRAEAEDLLAAGATEIEIAEPAISSRPEEIDLVAAALAHVVEPLAGKARTWTHLCYGDPSPILDRVLALPVDVVVLEAANSGGAVVDALSDLPADTLVGIGVLDVASTDVETVDDVRARIEHALTKVSAERLCITPDAGLHALTPDCARAKLESMLTAAASF